MPAHFQPGDYTPNFGDGIESGGHPVVSGGGQPSSFVIASYNIRYAVGRYLISSGLLRRIGVNIPRRRRETVKQNIKITAAALSDAHLLPCVDILALQEADKRTSRAGGVHVAAELGELFQGSWTHVGAGIPRGQQPKDRQWWLNFEEQIGLFDEGDTGVALLSHLPLQDFVRIDLPWHECPWRPRLAMGAALSISGKLIRIINAHVDPHASVSGQQDQLEVLADHANIHNGPVIVLGDFNTLSLKKCLETRGFMESHNFTTPFPTGIPTWRGAGLRMHADWIFVRGVHVKRYGVAQPLNVSDHWPIWAELEV